MSKPRMIAIDDQLDMAVLIAEVAEMVGFDAEVSENAKILMDSENRFPYEVIVIDLFMPDIDGFELLNALIENHCTAAIILVSGHDKSLLWTAGKIAEERGLNLLGILTKPFPLVELETLLKKHINLEKSVDSITNPSLR